MKAGNQTENSLYLKILFCTILTSCTSKMESSIYYVDLQHGFEASRVEVWADDHLCYKGQVTTESSLGFAHHAFEGECLNITTKVICNDGAVSVNTFLPSPKRGAFIGINFDPFLKTWNIGQQHKAFLYY